MAGKDTLAVIAQELGLALQPLRLALSDPDSFSALMLELGWDADAPIAAIQNLAAIVEDVSNLVETGVDAAETQHAIAQVAAFFTAVSQLSSASGLPPTIDPAEFAADFAKQLVDYLVADYLLTNHPRLGAALLAAGVIRKTLKPAAGKRPSYLRLDVAWNDLGNVLKDPFAIITNAYGWGGAAFDQTLFVRNMESLGRALGAVVHSTAVTGAIETALTQGATSTTRLQDFALRWQVIASPTNDVDLIAGLDLYPLPPTAAAAPGIAILPFVGGAAAPTIALSDTLSLILKAAFDLAGGVIVSIRPNQPVTLHSGVLAGSPASAAAFSVTLDNHQSSGAKQILLGIEGASRLEYSSLAVTVGFRTDSQASSFFTETALTDAALVIAPGNDADGFLAKLLPDKLTIDASVTVGLDSRLGVYFSGSGGLEIQIPAHISLGPIEIMSATISVKPASGAIPIELGATLQGNLGPLQAVVDNVGLRIPLTFPAHGGNLGPVNASLEFKPPNGVGLSVDAGVVKGGGYLFFDFDREEYAGVLDLSISEIVTVKAIGLITTKMPDGSKDFSLLIIITAEFGTGIQLGFGFTLIGLGGLLGLNRTMSLQPLMEGVRTGAINSIMFPQNPVANAPKIISDLRTIFPPYEGKFLIGPMAKLGWGTPTLVSVSLGVIIEIPGNIAILGVLKIALPAEEAALIVFQVNFAGAIEFDKSRLYFFAALFESRVLYLTLEGEMGLLVAWGDDANFVVSAGGFHPRFNPPPLPFPAPRRMAISILNTDIARIRTETYFAVTSNTVQFGSNTEIMFDVDVARVDGHLGFDALFQFSPFHFIIEVSASVSLKVFGVGLFSISLHFALEGPTPWRAHGTGSISFFFFDVSADFDITWGESKDTTLPPIAVIPLLKGEFDKLDNWRAQLPPSNNLLVSLRKLEETETQVLHPLGTLRVSQRAVPLDLKIDKVGNQKPSDANQFTLTATAGLVKADDADEQFAKAQFLNMSDADKLSQRAFDPMHGGVMLASGAQQLGSTKMGKRKVRYEEIIIDSNYKRFRRRFRAFTEAFFSHFLVGGAISKSVLSQNYKKMLDPFDDKVAVKEGGFTVAQTEDNKPYSASSTYFASEAMANQFLQSQVAANPDLHDALHVIPQYEARL